VSLPAGELLVGLTTVAIGALVLLRRGLSPAIVAGLFGVAGLVHGYALGESIVGAEPSPLVAYLAGLLIIQTIISVGACVATRKLNRPLTIAAGAMVVLAGGVTAALAAGALG
jgi:urease accessory protein